jgi:Galactosyltransferase
MLSTSSVRRGGEIVESVNSHQQRHDNAGSHELNYENMHYQSQLWTLAESPPDQPLDLKDPILIPPSLSSTTNNKSATNVLVLVLSHVDNIKERLVIRNTWAKDGHSNVIFVIGSVLSSASTTTTTTAVSLLKEEQALHQDLLEIPIIDSYDQLPEKLIQAYSWVLQNGDGENDNLVFDWIVKADDDMFVDIPSLEQYLIKYNPNVPMLIGNLVAYSEVQTDGRWKDVEFSKIDSHYPYWAKGSAGHVISHVALAYVVEQSHKLHRYQGEDTSLGIWLHDGTRNGLVQDMTYIHAEHTFVSHERGGGNGIAKEKTHLPCLDPYVDAVMIGHNLTPNEIEECWKRRSLSFKHKHSQEKNGTNNTRVWIGDMAGFETTILREEYVQHTTEMIKTALSHTETIKNSAT